MLTGNSSKLMWCKHAKVPQKTTKRCSLSFVHTGCLKHSVEYVGLYWLGKTHQDIKKSYLSSAFYSANYASLNMPLGT